MSLASSILRTTIQRAADGDAGEDEEVAAESPVQRVAAPVVSRQVSLPTLPVLTASRSARDASGAGGAGGGSHAATGGAPGAAASAAAAGSSPVTGTASSGPGIVQRSAAALPTIRPIAAHNPLRPAVVLQRETDDESGSDDEGEGGMASPWWTPAGEHAAVPSLPTLAGSDTGPAVQRSAFSAPTIPAPIAHAEIAPSRPAASAPARATSAAAAVQRSARASAPAQRLSLAVPSSSAAAQAAAPMAVPDWSAPGTTVTFPARSITSEPVVQTSRAAASGGTNGTTVQREGGTSSTTTTTTSTTSSAQGTAKGGHSERDLDELARALFGRIRTRLRADLLQDREASGFTFDNV